jgi:hypothetical protein
MNKIDAIQAHSCTLMPSKQQQQVVHSCKNSSNQENIHGMNPKMHNSADSHKFPSTPMGFQDKLGTHACHAARRRATHRFARMWHQGFMDRFRIVLDFLF